MLDDDNSDCSVLTDIFLSLFCLALNFQRFCADVVSVLGMTMSDSRDCLKYRILGSKEDIGSWGHEYVRSVFYQNHLLVFYHLS